MVVSDSPQTTPLESNRPNLLAHQRVQERVMGEFPLLPVRFGTVADSPSCVSDIHRLLDKRSQEFHGLLADVTGKVELGLKVLWRDERALFEEVLVENPSLRQLRDSLRHQSAEVLRREGVSLGTLVKEALDAKRRREAAVVLAPLRRIAIQVQENGILLDRMMLNAAFLVESEREAEFDQAVTLLDQELGQRLALKYVGPVPPYNFVNITVDWKEI